MSASMLNWNDLAEVKSYAQELDPKGMFLLVIKYPSRENYNIVHKDNFVRNKDGRYTGATVM